jgi:hypothetical protein
LGRGLSDSLFLQILILVCSSLCFWNICHQADDGEDDDQNPMSATKFLLFFWHEISESNLEIFNSEFGKSVNRFSKSSTPKELCWRTEKKERKRERKFSLNCWKAKKKKDVSSSLNAEQICLNLLLWILCLLLKSQNTHTHTHGKTLNGLTLNCACQSNPTKSRNLWNLRFEV